MNWLNPFHAFASERHAVWAARAGIGICILTVWALVPVLISNGLFFYEQSYRIPEFGVLTWLFTLRMSLTVSVIWLALLIATIAAAFALWRTQARWAGIVLCLVLVHDFALFARYFYWPASPQAAINWAVYAGMIWLTIVSVRAVFFLHRHREDAKAVPA